MDSVLLTAIPAVPLAMAGLILLLGRSADRQAGLLFCSAAGIASLFTLFLSGATPRLQSIWLDTARFSVTIGLRLDGLSWLMALGVAAISLLVGIFSLGHMARERDQARFFAALSFFLGSMLALVLADSFLLLFAAWEMVGVASYLLIGFWYKEETARQAALRAFLTTRFGDLGLLLGWLMALQLLGSTDIQLLLEAASAGTLSQNMAVALALLFFAAAIGKSAQLPLTTWLPEAMVGPTPVSALIHSATMVAAGVYLVLRLFPLFLAAPLVLQVMLGVGAVTALLAALIATAQTDLKRVLAWSTASQLGEMMMALGLGSALAGIFHLATHAVFKAALFLAAGAVDDQAGDRDLRRLGRLGRKMPLTAFVFGAAGLALAGVPPLSGFWSEETILSAALLAHPLYGLILVLLIFLAGLYISRAGTALFFPWPGALSRDACDPGARMKIPMLLLALAAIGLGVFLKRPLEELLQFSPGGELAWSWRLAAIMASLGGIALGASQVRRYGPVAPFGALPAKIEKALYAATDFPARATMACAEASGRVEQRLDLGAEILALAALRVARIGARAETLLDRGALGLGDRTMRVAFRTDAVERGGFSAGADRFAAYFARAGGCLKSLQNGRIYIYTLGIFVWVLVFGMLGFSALD